MPAVIVRGRAAWIASLIFGVALAAIGIIMGMTGGWSASGGLSGWLVGSGAAFAVFGLFFLIISIASKGRT